MTSDWHVRSGHGFSRIAILGMLTVASTLTIVAAGCGSSGGPRVVTDDTGWDGSLLDVNGLDSLSDVVERPEVIGDDVTLDVSDGTTIIDVPDLPPPEDPGSDAGAEIADPGPQDACQPFCTGRECGDDGCGGSCGTCAPGTCDGLTWVPVATCGDGTCQPGASESCDDGDECTNDACDPVAGCAHFPRNGACDDGVPCTVDDACTALGCQGVPVNCDDGKACTADGCDATTGACVHTAVPNCTPVNCSVDAECDDNDLCTRDKCAAGNCVNTVIVCDDRNPCTSDTCTRGPGYAYCTYLAVAKGTPCDDGNICTDNDVCTAKACGGTPATCDDGLVCTTDACDPVTGCSHVLQGGMCLLDGACRADGQTDSANACRVCAPGTGTTEWTTVADWTACGDGMHCRSGQCVATPCPTGYAFIPPGTFIMGSPETEPGRRDDEVQHQVTITKSFCLKATEVTEAEWRSLMGNNPYNHPCGDACPVEFASWWDAVAYCNRLSVSEALRPCYTLAGCTGLPGVNGSFMCADVVLADTCTGYRLPTEAEWEYAARAGTTTGTYNGTSTLTDCTEPNPVLDPIAWFCGNDQTADQPVKGKLANAWGLYDMLGNAWEWCWDWYGTYSDGPLEDPTGPTVGIRRVTRGGGWITTDVGAYRAARRNSTEPWNPGYPLSFRPLRTPARE